MSMESTTGQTGNLSKDSKCPVVVQAVRSIGKGGGVSGVAHQLDIEFRKAGYDCRTYTGEDVGISVYANNSGITSRLILLRDVVVYSVVGTMGLRSRYGRSDKYIVISHNDVVGGDIYINHGLHKSMIIRSPRRWRMLFFNPLHWFLLIREEIRHRLKMYRYVVCLSKYDKKQLISSYPVDESCIEIIPNGVDIDRFVPSKQLRVKTRKNLCMKREEFVLLFIGHEFMRKGLYYLVRSLKFLPANVVVWAAGGDDMQIKRAMRVAEHEGVSDRIRFLGKRNDIPDLMNGADIFVLPTEFEPWGLVGTEALACGRPILMTEEGGISAYLKDGVNGFFIRKDPEDIAAKTRLLMEDHALRSSMEIAARESALAYSWNNIARQYLELIGRAWREKTHHA